MLLAEEPKKPTEQKQEVQDSDDFFDQVEEAPISYKGAFTKMMLTLFALILLIVISVWMLKRISQGRTRGGGGYGKLIKVLERRPLSAKTVIYLIEVGSKKVLVAESQAEVRTLTQVDDLDSTD
jgi:flagellar biogenesis protein FliO